MKRLACTLLIMILFSVVHSQTTATPEVPYKRFPTVPPLRILLTDSSTIFTKKDINSKKGTIIMLFSPECDHCKKETEEIIQNIEKFEKIQIVMATPLPFNLMKEFYDHYELKRFKNIVVGRDFSFTLPTFYGVRSLPFIAFYDKKGNLIDGFEGSMPIEKVLEKFDRK